jgi:hypothetical protein
MLVKCLNLEFEKLSCYQLTDYQPITKKLFSLNWLKKIEAFFRFAFNFLIQNQNRGLIFSTL